MIGRVLKKIKNKLKFRRKVDEFRKIAVGHENRFSLKSSDYFSCMDEDTAQTGFDRHYVYHASWAARKLKEAETKEHVDISSTLYFCGIVSSFLKVLFYDYRPANLKLDNLITDSCDLNNLTWDNDSVMSLSCMHTIEHIGLGRYGDEYDYNGDLKAISELSRVLAINGRLLIVVPVGNEARIQFNAHRIYTKKQVIDAFKTEGLNLLEFTLIPEREEDGGLVVNPSEELLSKQRYGCGCFLFTKH